jgi:hypothetical protein
VHWPWGIQYSEFDGSPEAVLAEGDPYKAEVDQAKADFPPNTSLLFAFQVDGDIFNRSTLSAIDDLTRRYIEIDSALSVGSILNYRLNESDKKAYDRTYLVPELATLTDIELGAIRQIALADPDLTRNLLSPMGDFTIATIKYKLSEDTSDARVALAESAVVLRDSLRQQYPETRIYVVGGAAIRTRQRYCIGKRQSCAISPSDDCWVGAALVLFAVYFIVP